MLGSLQLGFLWKNLLLNYRYSELDSQSLNEIRRCNKALTLNSNNLTAK